MLVRLDKEGSGMPRCGAAVASLAEVSERSLARAFDCVAACGVREMATRPLHGRLAMTGLVLQQPSGRACSGEAAERHDTAHIGRQTGRHVI